jgi:hypothetical protein
MANIATYLEPTLKSTYNLWKLLSETSDTIVCYYFDIPYREYDYGGGLPKRYATEPSSSTKSQAKAIADWLGSNVRSFTYKELKQLTINNNYDPQWTSVGDLECIHKASLATGGDAFSKVSLFHVEEDLDTYHTQLRIVINKVVGSNYSSVPFTVDYPFMTEDLGTVDAVINLPSGVLDLITDSRKTGYKDMVDGGTSRTAIIALEKTFRDGTSEYAGIEVNGDWFVENHPHLGSFNGSVPFVKIYPYYTYLTV